MFVLFVCYALSIWLTIQSYRGAIAKIGKPDDLLDETP
jgi:hypothetical protein